MPGLPTNVMVMSTAAAEAAALPGKTLKEAENTVEEVKAAVEAARVAALAREAVQAAQASVVTVTAECAATSRAAAAACAAKVDRAASAATGAREAAERAVKEAYALAAKMEAEAARVKLEAEAEVAALETALAPRCLVEEAVVLEELKDRALTLSEPCLEVHRRQSARARSVLERRGELLEFEWAQK